jgi:hypothetical protein
MHRKHHFQQLCCCVTQLSQGPRRGHRYLVSALVRVRNLLWPLPGNDLCLHSHYLATGLRVTVTISSNRSVVMSKCKLSSKSGSRDSSVCIERRLWAGRPRSRFSIAHKGKKSSLLHNVQDCSGAHLVSYSMGHSVTHGAEPFLRSLHCAATKEFPIIL